MSDAITATVNVPEFARALLEYEKAVTNHDLPFILNRAGLDVAIKASGNTPKASLAKINSAMANRALFKLTNWRRGIKFGLPAIGGKVMSAPAIAELKRRHSSRAYIAAGWTPAIVKFGGHTRAHIATASKINNAKNQLASAGELVAILENAAEGAGKVGAEALEKALVQAASNMHQHAEERLAKTAQKYSAK